MNVATSIAITAATLLAAMGVVFVVLARAPGWERARVARVIAFSAAGYAAVDVVFSASWIEAGTSRLIGATNFVFAAIHASAWVVYAYGAGPRPLATLSRRLQAAIAISLAWGAACAVPGVGTSATLRHVAVPGFGVVYRQYATTWCSDTFQAWVLGVLLLSFVRFVRDMRRGDRDATVRVIGFGIFFAAGVAEVLVTSGVFQFIYTADLGFVAIVATLMIEHLRRVLRDAQELLALRRDLSAAVDRRTRERDVAVDALVHAERLAAVGRLAAGVGHEINNPLTYLSGNLELLAEALAAPTPPADALVLVDECREGTARIRRVVEDLRSYARPGRTGHVPMDVREVMRSALKIAAHELRTVVAVDEVLAPVAPVVGDPQRLAQVFVNLLVNAAHAVTDAQRAAPTITVRTGMASDGRVVIEVEDNGVGMSAEARRRAGEPYFSTRGERGGTGLGLFVSRGIVDALGGTLEFEGQPGVGTRVIVSLPASKA